MNQHRRHSIRLPGYDYAAPGAYFVTVCAHGGECLFGEIVNGEIRLNDWGRLVQACWDDLPNHYPHARLDVFVIMPNHIHGVIVLMDDADVGAVDVGAGLKPAPTQHAPTPQPAPTQPPADVGAGLKPAPTSTPSAPARRHGLPEIVRAFKTFSARRINELRDSPGLPIWQRNYYEHIVRNEDELHRIRQYILDNPLKWQLDRENPALAKRSQPG